MVLLKKEETKRIACANLRVCVQKIGFMLMQFDYPGIWIPSWW